MAVQMRTMLAVADNSGARKLQVILPLGGGLGAKAGLGDVVRIRETRPLSKLKRWSLEEIVRRSSLGQIEDAAIRNEVPVAN